MKQLIEKIDNSKRIAIISHINPDADALCSAIALKNIILNNFDFKQVDIFVDGNIGELYDPIIRNEVINPEPLSKYDLFFILDCPNISRTGNYQNMIDGEIINIDHHETNEKFGTINYVTPKLSSTCEYLYYLTQAYNLDLTNRIAKYLYQGIITDTNCFTSLSMSATTHNAVSQLLKFKFDSDAIRQYYFKNNSLSKTVLMTKAFKSIKIYKGRFLTMKIDYDTYRKAEATYEDTLGIVDNGININGIEACAILIETEPNKINVSLRNKGKVDIANVAKEFNGGGSNASAAFQYEGDIKDIERQVVEKIQPLIEEIKIEDEIIF